MFGPQKPTAAMPGQQRQHACADGATGSGAEADGTHRDRYFEQGTNWLGPCAEAAEIEAILSQGRPLFRISDEAAAIAGLVRSDLYFSSGSVPVLRLNALFSNTPSTQADSDDAVSRTVSITIWKALQTAIAKRSETHPAVHPEALGRDADARFEWAQHRTVWIFQWLVVHAFLPVVCDAAVLQDVMTLGPRLFRRHQFHHAGQRDGGTTLAQEFLACANMLCPHSATDVDAATSQTRRGSGCGHSSAQTCIRAFREDLGIEVPQLDHAKLIAGDFGASLGLAGLDVHTPLPAYMLKEAACFGNGTRLGPLCSRIYGDTILGLIASDPGSYLNATTMGAAWCPGNEVQPNGVSIDSFSALRKAVLDEV